MWEIVSCPDCACAHHEDNNDMTAFCGSGGRGGSGVGGRESLQDQDAAVAEAAKVKEQGSVGGSKPITAGVIAKVNYCSSFAIWR